MHKFWPKNKGSNKCLTCGGGKDDPRHKRKPPAPPKSRRAPRLPIGTEVLIVSGGSYEGKPGVIESYHLDGYGVLISDFKFDNYGSKKASTSVVFAEVVQRKPKEN